MGRYMRKNKVTMEVSQSLGVRTRARTLAMAQQQAASRKNLSQEQQQVNVLNFCYLELRSRKLEKLFDGGGGASKHHSSSARPPKTQQRRVRSSDAIGVVSVGAAPLSRSNSFTSSKQPPPAPPSLKNDELDAVNHVDSRTSGQVLKLCSSQLEGSCGDNAFDHDGLSSRDSFGPDHHRRLRESTPVCTDQELHRRIADAPGSSSKVRVTNRTSSNPPEESSRPFDAPTPEEIEEFFAAGEQEPDEEKKRLSDRYNYDFANDCPLPGRFEWTSASS
ncbi:hypothetical protein SELMODRAFT_414644 [Selaginella moellendorffii]|uniref:Uncharacterized protein KRP1-1 n=1 Tax=Selaginella moellendorffii TaxID=88036 RepID=D8RTG4_SELML|nr:hypothetical protein SELMODRAFT_414644 [Selaginella moellendorffii]